MTKISSCQSIKFGENTDVLKVYVGDTLVWDSGVVPPVTEFPPSAIYAWDFDIVDQNPPSDVEGLDLVMPKVGDQALQLPVLATLDNPFSGIRSGTLLYGSTYDDQHFVPQVGLNSTEWQDVKALSGSFRIDPQDFPNPGWGSQEFFYLACIRFNSGSVFNTFRGDILLGFQLTFPDAPVRGDWDLIPTVWRSGAFNSPSTAWIKSTVPYNTVRVTEGQWFTWHAKYEKDNLSFTITNQSADTARVQNISTYWGQLIDKVEYSGTNATSDGEYFNSGNCSWDNLALHDISFGSNDPQPLTCERYSKYFVPQSGDEDDLFIVWDFNQSGADAFKSCSEVIFGDYLNMGCNLNGSCELVDPILGDQYKSCRLNKTLWTPDDVIAADHRGLSYWFTYNGDTNIYPGVVLGAWMGGDRFLLVIETVYDSLNVTVPKGTRIVASIYDLFDTVTPEVPIEQYSSLADRTEFNGPTDRWYVQISNRQNWGLEARDEMDWYIYMGQARYNYGQVQLLEATKELSFSSTAVNWGNNKFVSLNKTPQGYEVNSDGRNITIDKVAFWVNPDVMGFDAL
jgi:hypothetical protein